MSFGQYIPSRILFKNEYGKADYVKLANLTKGVIEKYRKVNVGTHIGGGPFVNTYEKPEDREYMELENENKINDMRAKTINESDFDLWDDDDDKLTDVSSKIISKFSSIWEKSFQQAANSGLEFEVLQDLINQALDQIDWEYAAKHVEKSISK